MTVMESSVPTQSPPPKPLPNKIPSKGQQIIDLAGRMIAELRTIKASGGGPFPITVRELASRFEVSDLGLVKESIKKRKEFESHAVIVISSRSPHKARRLDAYVCLKEDIPRLAATDHLLEFVFELACSGHQRLFTIAELKKQLPTTASLDKTFQQTLQARLKEDSLPEGLGYLPRQKGTNYLFRLADIHPARSANVVTASAPVDSPSEPPIEVSPPLGVEDDFARKFENTFARLDREGGSHNFVKISDLRRALSEFDRTTFDRGVWLLRKERKFTANSSDGNYEQLSPEDRSAGIREGDSLLIYISRL